MVRIFAAAFTGALLALALAASTKTTTAAEAKKTHFVLMPYPIFKDGTGRELLILGTKKAKEMVRRENERKRKQEETFIRRSWIPTQIKA